MRKTRLFTPGPTPLFPQVQEALSRPVLHHRTEGFKELLLKTRRNLQEIFKTESEVLFLASSGTGAMEAAVCNLLGPEDHGLAVVAGKFGERWVEICQTHGISCAVLAKEAGQAASAEEICEAIAHHPGTRALLIQGCETSTATSHDLQDIARTLKKQFPDVLILVDAITALLSQPIETDAWGLDAVIAGSQKAFGLPPGLAFLTVSPRAIEKIQSKPCPTYYFNLSKEISQQKKGQSAFTPAVSLIGALYEATRVILEQGVDQVVAGAALMARCTRQGLLELGFQILSSSPANAVTGAYPPEGVVPADLVRRLREDFGIQVAGGQGELKNRIIRIAHLGYFDLVDVFSVLCALELCLCKMAVDVELGTGVRAALLEAASEEVTSCSR